MPKKKFKGQSKLKGRDAATGINLKKDREEVKDPVVVSIDPGTGNLGYIKLSDIKNVAMKPETPEYERNNASHPNPVIENRHRELHDKAREFFKTHPVHVVRPTPVQHDPDEIHFDRAKPTIAPKLTTNYVSDKFQHVPVIRGISTFLTPAEIESLHKGEFVSSGDFTHGLELSKQDPLFFAVVGSPAGTIIANSKGSVLLPNVKIPLGSKFDYRL